MPYPTYEGMMIDYQLYDIFTQNVSVLHGRLLTTADPYVLYIQDLRKDIAQHVAGICHMQANLSSYDKWFIVDEWSTALTDCAPGINGRGSGSLYDGTLSNTSAIGSCEGKAGDASTFSPTYKLMLRMFWEAQVITYEKADGWVMWTWKTASEDWSYKAGLKYGWIPHSPTDLKYPDICDEFNTVVACSPYADLQSCYP